MRLRLVLGLSLALALIAVSLPTNASTAPKPGTKCPSAGLTKKINGLNFTCFKTGKKLLWSKGVKLKNPQIQQTPNSVATPTPTPSASPTSTISPEPTSPPKQQVIPTATDKSLFLSKSNCKLNQNYSNYFNTGFGFPRSNNRLKNSGNVRGLIVYVEFTDVQATDDPVTDSKSYLPDFINFFKANSYGKLNFEVDVHPKYVKINKPSDSYKMDVWSSGDPRAYFRDGLAAADPFVDFSPYEFVVFMPPTNISKIIYGPSFVEPPFSLEGRTNEKTIFNGVMGGADQRTKPTRWIWLAHEIGHALGMEHQYSRDGEFVWDLMQNVYDFIAPEFLAWHRFLQDWMSDSQIDCLNPNILSSQSTIHFVSPIQRNTQDVKAVILKLSESEGLVIEARRKEGFDTLRSLTDLEGVLVYSVNVNKKSNENAINIVTTSQSRKASDYQGAGNIKEGESRKFAGFEVEVLLEVADGYWVKLSKQ